MDADRTLARPDAAAHERMASVRPPYWRTAARNVVGAALAVRDIWTLEAAACRRAWHAELDADARSRGLAPPGRRFARWSARYVDPMAGQVRHADRSDRTLAATSVRLVKSPSTVDRWTRAHYRPGWVLYPWWVGWLPTLRLRRLGRWMVRQREPWCRLADVSTNRALAEMVERIDQTAR